MKEQVVVSEYRDMLFRRRSGLDTGYRDRALEKLAVGHNIFIIWIQYVLFVWKPVFVHTWQHTYIVNTPH